MSLKYCEHKDFLEAIEQLELECIVKFDTALKAGEDNLLPKYVAYREALFDVKEKLESEFWGLDWIVGEQ